MDKVFDKKWTKFWTKNWTNILETFGGGGVGGGRGRYASCGHAGGLSRLCNFITTNILSKLERFSIKGNLPRSGQKKQMRK